MQNSDHYAIVVGLSKYPGLGESPAQPADLKGPENDADAIAEWLKSPSGGNLPPENVQIVKSSKFGVAGSATDAKPGPDEIQKPFILLEDLASANKERGLGNRVGRRLYVYMSGHGFSPKRNHGCLFAANATTRFGYNVYPSSWLEWYQDAAYFDEFVLWMDCCMNRISTLPPSAAPMQPLNNPNTAGSTFIAFAAQRPLKAAEREIVEDGGSVHGVFTWTLLQGLQGAAADGYGRVTGRSLADWLRNAQRTRMQKRDLDDPDVAEEPEISKEDSGIIFARGLTPKAYPVQLSFPPAALGNQARLWSGRPPKAVLVFQIEAGAKELSLRPGLYVVDVPASGLRQGFEVTQPQDIAVSEPGQPVVERGADVFDLDISPADRPTEIFIVDERFCLVDRSVGRLEARLPFGIYKVKTRLGRAVTERIILLDHGALAIRPEAVQIASAAPLPNTAFTHEYHVDAAVKAIATTHVTAGQGGKLLVMARAWSETGRTRSDVLPWDGIKIVNARGKVIADLNQDGERHSEGDPFAVCSVSVAPGAYFLRHRVQDGRQIEQGIIVPEGWFVHAYLLRLTGPEDVSFKARPRLSFIMQREGSDASFFSEAFLMTLETARIALADERRILSGELEDLLLLNFDNPIAGIIGGHLLLIEKERDPSRDIRILNQVVDNLRQLVGSEHPDVESLSLRCPDEALRRTKPIRMPPMFQRSWTLLFEASEGQRTLIPAALWTRVQAHSTLPPYLVWAADEDSKMASRKAIVDAAINLAMPALQAAMPATSTEAALPKAALEFARQMVSTPQFKNLSKQIRDSTKQSASRLHVPPSALGDIGRDIMSKLKG